MISSGPLSREEVELVHMARLALSGRPQDVTTFLLRLAKRVQSDRPEFASQINAVLASPTAQQSAFRGVAVEQALPRDVDSRLSLIRVDPLPTPDVEPILDESIRVLMDQLLAERAYQSALAEQGLTPTKSVLFTGAPGVGKSLMAKWIAHRLQRPLVTLDLSAVMSSFLGKTGANIRHVLDYAKASPCVLFLDELDSVAKRRDDATEIGELKRLVTVLLQEIDEWPASGLLIAATNHPALLDPAIWRRFDLIIDFPMPKAEQVRQAVTSILRVRVPNEDLIEAVSIVLDGYSFSDIGRELNRLIKQSVMVQAPLEDVLREYIRGRMSDLRVEQRKTVASCFLRAGFTQRETHEWTGVHRDTLRKMGMSTTDSE